MKPVPATFIPAQELLLPQVFGIMVVVELLTIKHVPTRCLDLQTESIKMDDRNLRWAKVLIFVFAKIEIIFQPLQELELCSGL